MLKKLFILICIIIFCGHISTAETIPNEIISQLSELYVFQDGLTRPLKVTVDEVSPECLYGKRLFPYSVDGQVIWFSENDFLPAQMSDEEQLFIRKISTYLNELGSQGNNEELAQAIRSIKAYQMKNGGDTLPSAFATKTDSFYNSKKCKIFIFCILLITFLVTCIRFFRNIVLHRDDLKKTDFIIAVIILIDVFFNLACRWIIGRHIPLTSNFEILSFLTFCLTLVAILMSRKDNILPVCNLISAGILLFSNILCDTSIKALNVALSSPLLGYHVAITIISYAIFFIMALNGIVGLFTKNEKTNENLRLINSVLLLPGLICLGTGILIGSIWAKTAWGAYWNWDPKETWALITLLVYGFGLSANKSSFFLKNKDFHIFCITAFAFVVFTFFGVNYLLGGRHGYL